MIATCDFYEFGCVRWVQISHLDLSANAIGDDGACAVAVWLASPECPLVSIDLHSCNIGDRGAAALFAALVENGRLTSLNLRANNLTDAVLPAMAEAATLNTTLQTLMLHCNDFTAHGYRQAQSLSSSRLRADVTTSGPSLEALCSVQ